MRKLSVKAKKIQYNEVFYMNLIKLVNY